MTSLAVELPPLETPRVISSLSAETSLSETEARELLLSVTKDVVRAVDESGGDLVVIGTSATTPATKEVGWDDPERGTRVLLEQALPDGAEPPVVWRDGSGSPAGLEAILAAAGETAPAASTAVVRTISPLLQRRHIDAAAMRLRTHDVVLGPSTGCRWYLAGISKGFSFDPAGAEAQLTALAVGAAEANGELALLPCLPGIMTASELASVVSILEVSRLTEHAIAPHTRAWLDQTSVHTDLDRPPELQRE